MNLLSPKNDYIDCQIIKFNKIENKNFLDALFKSDARGDDKQEIFYMALWINHNRE